MKKINTPSGLRRFSFVRLADVQSFRIRGGVGYATLKAGSNFEEIPFSSVAELNFDEAPYSVRLNVPTPENDNSRFLNSLVGVDCIFKLEMVSGVVYYIGSERFPGRLTYSHANSGDVGQYAGYSVMVKSHDISLFKEYVFQVQEPDSPSGGVDYTPALIFNSTLSSLPDKISSGETNVTTSFQSNLIEAVKASNDYGGYWQFSFNLYYFSKNPAINRIGRFRIALSNTIGSPSKVRVVIQTRGVKYYKDVDFTNGYSLEFDTRAMTGWTIESLAGVTPTPSNDCTLINVTPLYYDTRNLGMIGVAGEKVISVKDFVLDYLGN